jgi:DNA-binding PucR family transcriptional regulator
LDDLRQSRWGAEIALRVARTQDGPALLRWSELGALRLLGAAADHALSDALFDERLVSLLRDPRHAVLRETAFVYLDEAGNAAAAVARLSVHRPALYQRLEQVHCLTGLDVKIGNDRLHLHLALTLAPLVAST